jgi:hypothetical protein
MDTRKRNVALLDVTNVRLPLHPEAGESMVAVVAVLTLRS